MRRKTNVETSNSILRDKFELDHVGKILINRLAARFTSSGHKLREI